jgi:hypothetical protein
MNLNEEQNYEQETTTSSDGHTNYEVEETIEDQQDPSTEQIQGGNQPEEPAPRESRQDRNFRELREDRERAQRERDEAVRRLQEYEMRNQSRQAEPTEPDELELDPDSLVEGKHIRTVSKRIKQLEKSLEQANATAIENSLRAKFNDFDEVVSQDNVRLLRDLYPEIANVISSSPDLYSKSVAAYNFIKDKGLGARKSYDHQRDSAQINANKPRPSASISGKSSANPLSHANEFANGPLTEDYKKQLYREMLEAAKRT